MEQHWNMQQQQNRPNWKFKAILIALGLVVLLIFYYVEKFCYNIVNFLIYFDFLSILVFILLHVLLARIIVHTVLFPGGNFLVKKIMRYENGKIQAMHVSRALNALKNNLSNLHSQSNSIQNQNILNLVRSNLKNVRDVVIYCNTMYRKMKEIRPLSDYQEKFSLALTVLGDVIAESSLINITEDACKTYERDGTCPDLRNAEIDRYIGKILSSVSNLEELLNDFMLKRKWSTNVKNFWGNDIFGSMVQFRVEMMMKFNTEEFLVTSSDGKVIDVVVIKCDRKREDQDGSVWNSKVINNSNIRVIRNLMIICGPNGAAFEQFSRNLRFEDLYMRNNLDVLVWNYRGYGTTTGSAKFDNVKRDAECVIGFARKQNRWGKIGVHGISIGGLAACHLAGKSLVDFCIADRTFSSIEDIVQTFPYGKILHNLYQSLIMRSSNNVENFLNCKSPKILLTDPMDTIVKDFASLKTGIAKNVLKTLSKSNKGGTSENTFDLLLPKNDGDILFNSMLNIFTFIIETEHDTSDLLKKRKRSSEKNLLLQNSQTNNDARNIKYVNIKENKNPSEFELSTSYENDEDKPKMKKLMKDIFSIFSKFEAAGDTLGTIKKIGVGNKNNVFSFIQNFFTNMFVWGCLKTEEDESNDKVMSHKEIANRFREFEKAIKEIISRKESLELKNTEVFTNLESILEMFNKLKNKLSSLLFNNESDNSTSPTGTPLNINYHSPTQNSLSADNIVNTVSVGISQQNTLERLNLGNLIPLTCGHNGNFSENEIYLIRYELIKAKFI